MLVERRDCTTAYGVWAACRVGRTVRLYRAMSEICGMTMSQITTDYPRELEHTQNYLTLQLESKGFSDVFSLDDRCKLSGYKLGTIYY